MEEKDLLEKLRLSGRTIGDAENPDGKILKCFPSYRGNFGFHHVKGENFEAILLKGVYKDFLRVIEGRSDVTDTEWDEAAKTLNEAEEAIGYLNMTIAVNVLEAKIISASLAEAAPERNLDRRDYRIPRPLTPTEYSAGASTLYDESVMLNHKFIGSLFPQTISPFAASVLESVPNILNPIFMSCNLKTITPTAATVYGRPMTNVNAFEKMLDSVGVGKGAFRASFLPNVYLKKKFPFTTINKSYFPIEISEVKELLDEVKRTVNHISTTTLVEESYMEYPVNLAICAEYVFIKLADCAAKLLKYLPDTSQMLSAVFKTRKTSLFFSEETFKMPVYLDVACPVEEVRFHNEKSCDTIEKHLKKLPFFKRLRKSGKITKIINEAHALLDMRDEIYLTACQFVIKSKEVIEQIAALGLKKAKIKSVDEIYYLEHNEVRRVSFDSYFGDSNQTINYRRRLADRHAAQVVPAEIYAKDLHECPKISETMITKALALAEFHPLSLFGADKEATVTANPSLQDYKGYMVAFDGIPPVRLERYKNAEGFILEDAPLFGFTAEFACLNNIPVYSGVRFAPLILDGVKVKTLKHKISKI